MSNKRGTAYILQEPMKKDFTTGMMVPVMDLRKVIDYGDPVIVLQSGRISLTPGPTIDRIYDVMRDFCDDDFIVPIGDPSGITILASVASHINNGKYRLLKWDKTRSEYICVNIDIFYRTRKPLE